MARSSNVGINVHAQVTGKESVQALVAHLRELVALLGAAGVRGAGFLGGGLFGGTPAAHLGALTGGGYAAMGAPAQQAMLVDAIGAARARAVSVGALRTDSQVEAQLPRPAAPALPGGGVYAMAGAAVPGQYRPGWVDVSGQRALPAPGAGVPRYTWGPGGAPHGPFGPPPGPPGGPPGAGAGGIAPIPIGGQAQADQAAQRAARTPGGRMGMHLMYAMMFQAFFGVLFGGLREYTQSIAQGRTPPGGGAFAAMRPAIYNLAGMGAGFALGGIYGAIGGGMVGQLVGQYERAQDIARESLRTAQLGAGQFYGPYAVPISRAESDVVLRGAGLPLGPGAGARFLNLQRQMALPLWMQGIGDPGATEYTRRMFSIFGEDGPGVGRRLGRYMRDPFLREAFAPSPSGATPYGYDREVAAYMAGGTEAWEDYLRLTGRPAAAHWQYIAPIWQAQQQAQISGVWQAPYAARVGLGGQIGSQRMRQIGIQGQIGVAEAQLAPLLMGLRGVEAGGPAETKLTAAISALRTTIDSLNVQMVAAGPPAGELHGLNILQTMMYVRGRTGGMSFSEMNRALGYDLGGIEEMYYPLTKGPVGGRRILREMYGQAVGILGGIQERHATAMQGVRERYLAGKTAVIGQEPGWERQYPGGLADVERIYQEQIRFENETFGKQGLATRRMMADIYGQLSQGWMERLVSTAWGVPGRLTGVMSQFNYAGVAGALERRSMAANRFFGGRNLRTDATFGLTPGVSDISTGRGGLVGEGVGGVTVNMTVNVAAGVTAEGLEIKLNQFKNQVVSAAKTLGETDPAWS